jgi:tetratricopeptide (TPR) repeat protein
MRALRQLILTGGTAAMLMVAQPLMAQSAKVTSAWNYLRYKEYEKARDAINEAILNEKTMNDAKTWLYRGQAYRGIAEDEKLAAKNPDAVMTAFESLKKAQQLDGTAKEHTDELQLEFFILAFDLYNAGSNAYNEGEADAKNYGKAYNDFMAYQESLDLMGAEYRKKLETQLKENQIDPKTVQHLIGSSAQLSGNTEKALEYYSKLVESGYTEPGVYVALSGLYRDTKKDTAQALAILDKGLAIVKDKRDLLNSKLDIFIKQKKYQDVINLGKEVLTQKQDTATLTNIYIGMGNAYYEMKMPKEAEDVYAKALALDPEGFNSNFSIGIALYEQGRVKYNASLDEKSEAKAKKLEDEYTALFSKAIPYLEKAQAKNPDANDKEIYGILAELYSKTGDYTKAKEYSDKAK